MPGKFHRLKILYQTLLLRHPLFYCHSHPIYFLIQVQCTGFVINFLSAHSTYRTGILSIESGTFNAGTWKPFLHLNGDEDHQGRHLRIPLNDWDIQHIKLYEYK